MKVDEKYNIRLDKIKEVYLKETEKVLIEAAEENNIYKIGDIIQDHHQTGRIEAVIIRTFHDQRCYTFIYKCERLTKKLKSFKNGEKTNIWLDNIQIKIE